MSLTVHRRWNDRFIYKVCCILRGSSSVREKSKHSNRSAVLLESKELASFQPGSSSVEAVVVGAKILIMRFQACFRNSTRKQISASVCS